MKPELEKIFFKSIVEAIVKEEEQLNELFNSNNILYQEILPTGVSCLFETTYVYLIIKQLLKNRFPLLLSWEHPYNNNSSSKVDLALLDIDKSVDSFIEFKIWKSEDGSEIKLDIKKIKNATDVKNKYLVVIEHNSDKIVENAKILEGFGLVIIEKTQLVTSYYNNSKYQNEQVPMNVYFIKVT